jgi:hypothetical protein
VPNRSKDDFFKTIRTGVDPNGNQVKPPMPWKRIGKLDDAELEALYTCLHALTNGDEEMSERRNDAITWSDPVFPLTHTLRSDRM